MGKLKRTVLSTSEAAAPRGRILRLQVRITVENLITAGFVAFAVADQLWATSWPAGAPVAPIDREQPGTA